MPLLIDKPEDYTSFDVVAIVRRQLRIKKIGHAGTLDPAATGLLIVLVGRQQTKQQDEFMGFDKEYLAEITLGTVSTTYDKEGEFTEQVSQDMMTHISQEEVAKKIAQFIGEIRQRPPVYSAIKIGGKKLYQLARQDKIRATDVPFRTVHIYELEILRYESPILELRVKCGKGTYIRSLAHDLGEALGTGAYLSALRRTKIGEYSVEQALDIDTLKQLTLEQYEQLSGTLYASITT